MVSAFFFLDLVTFFYGFFPVLEYFWNVRFFGGNDRGFSAFTESVIFSLFFVFPFNFEQYCKMSKNLSIIWLISIFLQHVDGFHSWWRKRNSILKRNGRKGDFFKNRPKWNERREKIKKRRFFPRASAHVRCALQLPSYPRKLGFLLGAGGGGGGGGGNDEEEAEGET